MNAINSWVFSWEHTRCAEWYQSADMKRWNVNMAQDLMSLLPILLGEHMKGACWQPRAFAKHVDG
jgi:hypothetical protein